MMRNLLQLCLVLGMFALTGCSDSGEDGVRITGPEVSKGPGRVYPINEISFLSTDGVPISALFGASESAERVPTVILLHDLGGNKEVWLTTTDLFIDLLERGYAVVAVDMRGHGQTPLPDNRQVLLIEDLKIACSTYATLNWLLGQRAVDPNRMAVIGDGSGGNVAFVSSGCLHRANKNQRDALAGALGGILLESPRNRTGHFSFRASVHSLLE